MKIAILVIVLVLFIVSEVSIAKSSSVDSLKSSESLASPVGGLAAGALSAGKAGSGETASALGGSKASALSGARASGAGKSGVAVARSTAIRKFRGGKRNHAQSSATGYETKYGKQRKKYLTYASGHKKTFGTVKTFHHSKGFAYGNKGAYGAVGGSRRGFVSKKANMRRAGVAGSVRAARLGTISSAAGHTNRVSNGKAATMSGAHGGGELRRGID